MRKRRIVRILKRIKKLQIARSLTADASVSETAQQEISRKKKNELVVEKSVKELVEDKKKDEHHIEVPSAKGGSKQGKLCKPFILVQLQTMKISHSIMRNAPLDEEELKIVIDFELMAHKTIKEFYNISLIKRMSSNFYEQETHYMKARSDQESVLQDKELSFDDISSSPNRNRRSKSAKTISNCNLEFPPIGQSCAGNNAGKRFQEFIRMIDPSYCDIHGLNMTRCSSNNEALPNPRKVCANFASI